MLASHDLGTFIHVHKTKRNVKAALMIREDDMTPIILVLVCASGLRQRVLEQTVEGRQRFAAIAFSKLDHP
jgi:hypothetical protein